MKTELTKAQQDILELIRKGRENKVNLRYIAKLSGLSLREVSYVIADLREYYPICSTTLDGGGVWIADCNSDIVKCVNQLQKVRNQYQKIINFMEGHIK